MFGEALVEDGMAAGRGGAVAPGPAGLPVVFEVMCGAGRHDVALWPDWSATTPHDLESERVLAAFGGSSPCLSLVRDVVPVAWAWLSMQLRSVLPGIKRAPTGWWPDPEGPCCRRLLHGRPEVEEVAVHVRTAGHQSAVYGVDHGQLAAVTAAVGRAHRLAPSAGPDPAAAALAEPCVRPAGSVVSLWRAGIAPERVVQVHAAVSYPGLALPARFYLRLLTKGANLRWVRRAAEAPPRPGEELLRWVAQARASEDLGLPAERAEWLDTGLPPRLIFSLSEAGYAVADVRALAAAARRTLVGAAAALDRWVSAGCRPSVADLVGLEAYGGGVDGAPSAATIARFNELVGDGAALHPTAAGLLIRAVGSARAAAAWAVAGTTDPGTAARALADGRGPCSLYPTKGTP